MNLSFPLTKLLDPKNKEQAAQFNKFVRDSGLIGSPFSHKRTYNTLMVECLYEANTLAGGIWDAYAQIDLEKNLLAVSGNEYCSGGGARITVWFDVNGNVVDQRIIRLDGEDASHPNLDELVKSLKIQTLMVEPITEADKLLILYLLPDLIDIV